MNKENEKFVMGIEDLTQRIIQTDKKYNLSKIISAYEFAVKAHGDQKRSSGEPYIIHPLSVAGILVDLGMDTDTVCVGLLHDVVEDTEYTLDDIRRYFGQPVATLVDGVTKIGRVPVFDKEEQKAGNFMKVLLAMSHDIRVMIIKLADRLHNIRTLGFLPPYKQRRIAQETMNIYAPIAHRLGIRAIYEELEDTCFRYLDPFAYSEIEHALLLKKDKREVFIDSIIQRLGERLRQENFAKEPVISGRVKSIYGIYKKVYVAHKNMDEIYDKYAIRVIVSSEAECYLVLGIVHSFFRPIPNRFKDYIAAPKANMYQSLHTTVTSIEEIPFEVQIRTWDMHVSAEYGIAAHWKYKEGIQRHDKMEERLAWVRQVIEAQQTSDDVEEIVNIIKNDLAPEEIVVMTPRGDSIALPQNATVLDFAYRIHTEVGHKCIGAKVDGKMVPLDYTLRTGQICEIMRSKDPAKGPSRAWQQIVQTNEAKSKIRSWFKKECREENIQQGRAALEQEFKRGRINIPPEELADFLGDDLKRHNCETLDDFYASIGYGGVSLQKILPRLKDQYDKKYGQPSEPTEPKELPIVEPVRGDGDDLIIFEKIDDLMYKFAKCCSPMPGDEIVGFLTRGHGMSVHSVNCVNYISAKNRNNSEEMQRWRRIKWQASAKSVKLTINLEIIAVDRVGLAFDVTKVLAEQRVLIHHMNSRLLKNGNAILDLSIQVDGSDQLNNLFGKIRRIKGVITVDRARK